MNIGQYVNGQDDLLIVDSFTKADSVINRKGYQRPMCSISGGADSDIMLDLCHKVDEDGKIAYVWFDTGLEYQATKDHLLFLERKYSIRRPLWRTVSPSLPVSEIRAHTAGA